MKNEYWGWGWCLEIGFRYGGRGSIEEKNAEALYLQYGGGSTGTIVNMTYTM